MASAPCKECGARPKMAGRHRCLICHTRHQPIDQQVTEAERRLGMVPVELRRPRVPAYLWPAGQRWCGSCQSFVDLQDVQGSRCRACNSAATHSARIEKTYGLDDAGYKALLAAQGGRCAICRARPQSKRLAVDHDHQTGAVRGLLCSRCNHDLMGAAWDSLAIAHALVGYITAPPALGNWVDPATAAVPAPPVAVSAPARLPRADLMPAGDPWAIASATKAELAYDGSGAAGCEREHFLPTGSMRSPSGTHWLVWLGKGDPPPY